MLRLFPHKPSFLCFLSDHMLRKKTASTICGYDQKIASVRYLPDRHDAIGRAAPECLLPDDLALGVEPNAPGGSSAMGSHMAE